jgi:hypothetical protein
MTASGKTFTRASRKCATARSVFAGNKRCLSPLSLSFPLPSLRARTRIARRAWARIGWRAMIKGGCGKRAHVMRPVCVTCLRTRRSLGAGMGPGNGGASMMVAGEFHGRSFVSLPARVGEDAGGRGEEGDIARGRAREEERDKTKG